MLDTPLRLDDLAAAQGLVAEAGWNQNAADWRVFLELGQGFAVRDGERLAATAATLPYPSGFGWISMVLVGGEYRRRGDTETPYQEDVTAAASSYREAAKETFGQAAEAARKVVESFRSGFNRNT